MEIPCDFDCAAFTKSVEVSLRLRESSCFDICSFANLLAASCDHGFLRLHHIERSLVSARRENAKEKASAWVTRGCLLRLCAFFRVEMRVL